MRRWAYREHREPARWQGEGVWISQASEPGMPTAGGAWLCTSPTLRSGRARASCTVVAAPSLAVVRRSVDPPAYAQVPGNVCVPTLVACDPGTELSGA